MSETVESVTSGVAGAELRQFIERIERLEEEKKALADDVRDVFAELKGRGFDTKAVRKLIALRRKDPNERAEEEAILELYKSALVGVLAAECDQFAHGFGIEAAAF